MGSIIPATAEDIPVLVKLINSAYRGEASKQGWTTEADLLEGPIRTDEAHLSALMQKEQAVLLKYTSAEGEILGCVFLENRDGRLYLGLLTVSPRKQGGGIGKLLLRAADDHAIKNGCSAIFMTVFTARPELILWYERHGFKQTDLRKPYTDDMKFGVPTRQLEFVVMEKIVGRD